MKRPLLYLLAVALLASCAAPKKYSYNFGYHKYQTVEKPGVNKQLTSKLTEVEIQAKQTDLETPPAELTADNSSSVSGAKENPVVEKVKILTEKYSERAKTNLTNEEKQAFRKEVKEDVRELKKDLKRYIKEKGDNPDSAQATKELDKNLKIALILAVAAVITSIFFWQIGAVLWIIALVFFIMWLIEQ